MRLDGLPTIPIPAVRRLAPGAARGWPWVPCSRPGFTRTVAQLMLLCKPRILYTDRLQSRRARGARFLPTGRHASCGRTGSRTRSKRVTASSSVPSAPPRWSPGNPLGRRRSSPSQRKSRGKPTSRPVGPGGSRERSLCSSSCSPGAPPPRCFRGSLASPTWRPGGRGSPTPSGFCCPEATLPPPPPVKSKRNAIADQALAGSPGAGTTVAPTHAPPRFWGCRA